VGHVVRVGADVDEALVGRLIPVPEEIDALQLATLPVEAATAHALLHDYVTLTPGDWIGLNLSNSTVGHYLIPLAERAGVSTLAVVRRESAAEQVRQLGADLVLVDGDDLDDRAAAALGGASLRLLLERTGDPAEVAKLAGEEKGPWWPSPL
jgi:NADPH:quinone reductase-like Zn-dependent oxidoreductase